LPFITQADCAEIYYSCFKKQNISKVRLINPFGLLILRDQSLLLLLSKTAIKDSSLTNLSLFLKKKGKHTRPSPGGGLPHQPPPKITAEDASRGAFSKGNPFLKSLFQAKPDEAARELVSGKEQGKIQKDFRVNVYLTAYGRVNVGYLSLVPSMLTR